MKPGVIVSKLLHELTYAEYNDLLKSGMMYVYYPECTGSYFKDSIIPEECAIRYADLELEDDGEEYMLVFDDAANDDGDGC